MRSFWILIVVLIVGGGLALGYRLLSGEPTAPGATVPAGASGAALVPTNGSPAPLEPRAAEQPRRADHAEFEADLGRAIDAILPPADAEPKPLAATPGTEIDLPVTSSHPIEKLVKARARKQPDGSVLLDDQFTVIGSGTEADPYVLSFELLMSAENTYQPRKGLLRLPQRVAFLNEAWVKITGYAAFPLSASDPQELLVMFNQWDGCCIGVPPTAYDAVEVKLAAPLTGNDRFATHGTVTGRFKVDPYVDSNYLLGLYVLESARFGSDKIDANLRQQHNQP